MQGPIDMTFLFGLYDLVPPEFDKFKFAPFSPQQNPRVDPKKDIFEYHYEQYKQYHHL